MDHIIEIYLDKNIRLLRKRLRISQAELAAHLGINRGNVASYELGTHPPVRVLITMSDLFEVSIDHLIRTDLSTLRSISEYRLYRADLGLKKVAESASKDYRENESIERVIEELSDRIGKLEKRARRKK